MDVPMTTETTRPDSASVVWRGVIVDQRTADMLDEVARLTDGLSPLAPTSGSYSDFPAQAGTHRGGGAINLAAHIMPRHDAELIVSAMRRVGFAAWLRPRDITGRPAYIQGIAIGCPDMSPQAAMQVRAYQVGLDGLAGGRPDDGPRGFLGATWESYRQGGE